MSIRSMNIVLVRVYEGREREREIHMVRLGVRVSFKNVKNICEIFFNYNSVPNIMRGSKKPENIS